MDEPEPRQAPAAVVVGNRVLEIVEYLIYALIAAMLALLAFSVLWRAVQKVPAMFYGDDVAGAALLVLDTLLLVFIVVELLFAVRMTVTHRELVAEPFLLVGMIASIKEIVVLSVKAAEKAGKGEAFRDSLLEIAVLGVLVLVLGVTAWLLRLKEQHPDEASGSAEQVSDRSR